MTMQRPVKVGGHRVWICSTLDIVILIGVSMVMGLVIGQAFQ
jgi:hypothetical protein